MGYASSCESDYSRLAELVHPVLLSSSYIALRKYQGKMLQGRGKMKQWRQGLTYFDCNTSTLLLTIQPRRCLTDLHNARSSVKKMDVARRNVCFSTWLNGSLKVPLRLSVFIGRYVSPGCIYDVCY